MGKLLDILPSIAGGILAALIILTFVNTTRLRDEVKACNPIKKVEQPEVKKTT